VLLCASSISTSLCSSFLFFGEYLLLLLVDLLCACLVSDSRPRLRCSVGEGDSTPAPTRAPGAAEPDSIGSPDSVVDPDPTASAWTKRRFDRCYQALPHFPAELVRLIVGYEPMGLIERYQLCIEPALNAQLLPVYSHPDGDLEHWRFKATTPCDQDHKHLLVRAVTVDVNHLCCALAGYAERCAWRSKAQIDLQWAAATSAAATKAGLPDPLQPLKPLLEVQLNAVVRDWGAKVMYAHHSEYPTRTNAGTWLVVAEEDVSHPQPATTLIVYIGYLPPNDGDTRWVMCHLLNRDKK
jgi:hypothetical protein